MNNVLVIGGTGFIGTNIVKRLILDGYKVSVFDLPKSDLSAFGVDVEKIKVFYGKLEQLDLIKELLNKNSIDLVIHLASTLIPSSSLEDYLFEFETIIKPTIKLLPFLSETAVKIIYFSSGGTIYGNGMNVPYTEQDETAPISYYGQSKLILEQSIRFENRKSGLKFLIIRPSNPYGHGQRINGKQGLIATSIGRILKNEKITIWGDGSIVRDYIYIDDLVSALIKIIEGNYENEIFNIGSGEGYSVNQVLDALRKCIGGNIEVEYLSSRPIDVSSLVLDIAKFDNIFRSVNLSLEEGIRKFYTSELRKREEERF